MSAAHVIRTLLLAVLVLATTTVHGVADDDDIRRDNADRAYSGVKSGELLPLADLTAMIEARFSGRILEVEFDDDDDGPVYELHVLDRSGRVFEVEVDARTGKIIEIEEDD